MVQSEISEQNVQTILFDYSVGHLQDGRNDFNMLNSPAGLFVCLFWSIFASLKGNIHGTRLSCFYRGLSRHIEGLILCWGRADGLCTAPAMAHGIRHIGMVGRGARARNPQL